MEISLNGKKEILENKMTLTELILSKGLNPDTIVVEHNSNLIKKEEWSSVSLKENDILEVLRFVGGG
ncbi:MAG: sulfur carrier protein ThiS [Epulopiscium sp.]|nr:sulfur carrier protein ThiS [Candidatus Epulonipiscium sp.]